LNNNKLGAKWLIFVLLVGAIAGVSQGINGVHAAQVPVQGASVEADGLNGFGYSTSDSQGFYNVTSFLDTGNYSVMASAAGFVDTTVDDIEVTAGAETTNVDIVLPVSGGISGTITDAISSAPLQSVYVEAVNETGGISYSSYDFTDANGDYQIITNLITGSYNVTVFFAEGHITKEISGVSVTAGVMTNNVDMALDRSATISGTVTDSVSAAALQGVLVYALNSNGDYVTSDVTDSSGQYTFNTDLVTDVYNITAPFPTDYLPNSVDGVAVTAGSQYTVDMSLERSGAISGFITNAVNGQPVVGAFVSASSNGFGGYDSTDDTGHYQITDGLGTGSYTVTAFYGLSFNETTGVSVTQGSETSGVNMELTIIAQPSGTISGRVTEVGTGDPIQYASVVAEGLNGYGSDTTDSNGDYVIDTGLGTGSYNVTVTETGFVSQEMTGINVVEDQVTANVDFELAVAPSGRISGHILTEGTPIPDFPSGLCMLGIFVVAAAVIVAGKMKKPTLKFSKTV
jgi:hypothetical protein